MIAIRRLDSDTDRDFYAEAWAWDIDAPRWYQDSDAVFRPESFDEYMKLAHGDDQCDVGVFDDELIGLITVTLRGKGVYEGHLSAKRGANLEMLAEAVLQIRCQLFERGMSEAYLWVAAKNRAIRKLCANAGFYGTFVTMLRGSSHNRPIEWEQWVTTRTQWESEQRIELAA